MRYVDPIRRALLATGLAPALSGIAAALPTPANAVTFGANVSSLIPLEASWPKDVTAALTALHSIGATV